MHVLGLAGSLRKGSINRQLLQAADVLASKVRLELFDELGALPLYDEDLDVEPAPRPVGALRSSIARADAVLIATPEYNSSIPGPLKNALDWASRPFPPALADKPVAVVGASPSRFGAIWAQAEVRKVATAIGADVIDQELPVAEAYGAFDHTGRLTDVEVRTHLSGVLDELVARARSGASPSMSH